LEEWDLNHAYSEKMAPYLDTGQFYPNGVKVQLQMAYDPKFLMNDLGVLTRPRAGEPVSIHRVPAGKSP